MENVHIKKIKVYYFAPENSGVAYYRFYQPLEELRERGLIELRNWGFDFTGKRFELPEAKELKELADWGDIFIFGRLDTPEYFRVIKTIKEFSKKPVLLDIDDNIFSITPYLPAHLGYEPNGPTRKIHEEIAKYVDGIVVSTEALAEIYKKYNKVLVIENAIKYILERRQHDGINIGYMVSGSHLENAQIIEGAVIRILKEFPQVRFYFTKAFQGFMERIPKGIENQINYVPFFPLKDYLKYVQNLNLDIGLAPLMSNDFNKCKSNIRVLEYWQNQMAVIASPMDEYRKTITHGLDGYLSNDNEWYNWIKDLIENPELRNYFIYNSRETLRKFDIRFSADKYWNLLREIHDANTR